MTTIKEALLWITDILDRAEVPYQIVGGLAAHAYGGSRPLYDIDMYIPEAGLSKILAQIEPFFVRAPSHFVNESWDITFMAMDYKGQRIEIGIAEGTKIFDPQLNQWIDEDIKFDESQRRSIEGIDVWVMPKSKLLAYKRRLARDVDVQDIAELERA